MSNDAQLSMNFHRIEQKTREIEVLKKSFEDIEERLQKIESILPHTYIQICHHPSNFSLVSFTKICTQIYTLRIDNNNYTYNHYENIEQLYNLKELTINITGIGFSSVEPYLARVKSLTVEKLVINTSLKHISNFPFLWDLTLNTCGTTNIVSELNEIEHKINKLTLIGCTGVNQAQLMTYCTSKNIALDMR